MRSGEAVSYWDDDLTITTEACPGDSGGPATVDGKLVGLKSGRAVVLILAP